MILHFQRFHTSFSQLLSWSYSCVFWIDQHRDRSNYLSMLFNICLTIFDKQHNSSAPCPTNYRSRMLIWQWKAQVICCACSLAPHLPSLAACPDRRDRDEKELNKPSGTVINPTACQCGEILELLQKKVGISSLSILTNWQVSWLAWADISVIIPALWPIWGVSHFLDGYGWKATTEDY